MSHILGKSGFIPFPKIIYPKVSVIAQLGIEPVYFEAAIHYFCHNAHHIKRLRSVSMNGNLTGARMAYFEEKRVLTILKSIFH